MKSLSRMSIVDRRSWLYASITYYIYASVAVVSGADASDCAAREYGKGNLVCVCNGTYCDNLQAPTRLPTGEFVTFTSSKGGLRFHREIGEFSKGKVNFGKESIVLTVDRSSVHQKVVGFGGALTDAAGINIASLSDSAQDLLLRSYFSSDGLEFNVVRVPIGGSDFSTRPYSYDDDGAPADPTLEHFQLAEEDTRYKIPYLKKVKEISNREVLLLGSVWSAPKWMKTNNDFIGKGQLKHEYHQTWADYFVKFLDEYSSKGLTFWAITTQNEPFDGFIPKFSFNCMGWTADQQRMWIADHLGPTLQNSDHHAVQILAMDDQRTFLNTWPSTLFADEKVSKYVSGIAVHWYLDFLTSPKPLNKTHYDYPDKFLMYTEACTGESPNEPVLLGSWERGEKYAYSIIETMTNWVVGWIDWNLALDLSGGPNWANNFVDSAIIVNATADEFYKQPMYYALGHFSKFVPNGSHRIGLNQEENNFKKNAQKDLTADTATINAIAYSTPDGATVVVLLNKYDADADVTITDPEKGHITKVIPAKSIHTLLYW